MICQQCGYERATTQPSCPVCGSTQFLLPSQERRVVTQAGPGTRVTYAASSPVTLSPTQTLLTTPREAHVKAPEATLQGKRYLLVEQQERQQWSPQVSEAWWLARDLESREEVSIGEVALPLSGTTLQTFFRVATKAALASSTHLQMLRLLNVFLEQGRGYFVFTHPAGESLLARIQRKGLLNEQEAIECYAQVAEALVFLSHQHPTLVHGSIQPNHLVRVGSRWVLTRGSSLIAGGAMQFLPDLRATRLAAQSTPASDLFALSAVLYYAVTGTVPPPDVGGQQAGLQNSTLSPAFAGVLLKGVHPREQVRYQHPSEIVEALGRRTEGARQDRRIATHRRVPQPQGPTPSGVLAQPRSGLLTQDHLIPVVAPPVEPPRSQHQQEGWTLLPPPADLPPFSHGPDMLTAFAWTGGILLCGTLILLAAR